MADPVFEQLYVKQLAGTSFLGRSLADDDGKLTNEGTVIVWGLISFIFCTLVHFSGRIITPLYSKNYKGMNEADKNNWDSRYSSMLHSALCVWYAYDLVYTSDFFFKEGEPAPVLRNSVRSYACLGMSAGYFVVDFYLVWAYDLGGFEMIAHHVGSLLSVMVAASTGECHMHALWMLVTEFTTPFINFRWWLDKAEMKNSIWYLLNAIAIVLSWTVFRIMAFPPFFYVMYQQRHQIKLMQPISQVLLATFPLILTFLNLYWYYKIIKGGMKLLMGPSKKAKKE